VSKLIKIATCIVAMSVVAPGLGLAQSRAKLTPAAGTPMATSHLNPNTATEAELRAAPLLGPTLAGAVVRGRPYKTQRDFARVVAGKVPEAQLPALYAAVFVPVSLNTGAREDIMLIPGMTRRMAHEFEEYRPYKDLTQFDREIGKYVNPPEVARLRSYVTLP
jgi:DNA uptake protein ComE-like DNA-binding protein